MAGIVLNLGDRRMAQADAPKYIPADHTVWEGVGGSDGWVDVRVINPMV
jgi:hypothetical protein